MIGPTEFLERLASLFESWQERGWMGWIMTGLVVGLLIAFFWKG